MGPSMITRGFCIDGFDASASPPTALVASSYLDRNIRTVEPDQATASCSKSLMFHFHRLVLKGYQHLDHLKT